MYSNLGTALGAANVTLTGGGSYDNNTGRVTFTATDLAPGASAGYVATFLMPDAPAGGYVSGLASASSPTTPDPVSGNNSAGVTTAVAPGTADNADLAATIPTSPAAAVAAGSTASYSVRFRNNGASAAVNATPVVYLPAGLGDQRRQPRSRGQLQRHHRRADPTGSSRAGQRGAA